MTWTRDECETLIKYQALWGNEWARIACQIAEKNRNDCAHKHARMIAKEKRIAMGPGDKRYAEYCETCGKSKPKKAKKAFLKLAKSNDYAHMKPPKEPEEDKTVWD